MPQLVQLPTFPVVGMMWVNMRSLRRMAITLCPVVAMSIALSQTFAAILQVDPASSARNSLRTPGVGLASQSVPMLAPVENVGEAQ